MDIPKTLGPNGKKDPTYVSWSRMKQRIKRGYTTLDDPRWLQFAAFFVDMGARPAGMTLDRLDGESGYSKGNCRWATAKEQQNNRKDTLRYYWQGRGGNSEFWARELDIDRPAFLARVHKYGAEDARTFAPRAEVKADGERRRIASRQQTRSHRGNW